LTGGKGLWYKNFMWILGISLSIGLAIALQDLGLALTHIATHEYLHYRLYGLIARELKAPLATWLLSALAVSLAAICLYLAGRFFRDKFLHLRLEVEIKNRRLLKKGLVLILCALFLVFCGWLIYMRWSPGGFGLWSVLLNIGALLLTYGFYRLLRQTSFKKLVRGKLARWARGLTVVLVVCLCVLVVVVALIPVLQKPAGPNVLVLTVDCLRPDHLGVYGYARNTSPHIDALARQGVVFLNAFSPAPWTKPAVASLFTSRFPGRHGAVNGSDILPASELTLAEILRNRGFRTFFFNGGNPVIGDKFNFYQGFTAVEGVNRAPLVIERFLNEVDFSSDRPFFAYLHLMDAHLPYHQNPFNTAFTTQAVNPFLKPGYLNQHIIREALAGGVLTEADKEALIALYDGQIKYVDRSLEKLLAGLKAKGVLDDTVIILTADHGEEFFEHGNFEHGHSLYNELLRVPLIVVGKRFKPGQVNRAVSLVDIFPFILETTGTRSEKLDIAGRSFYRCCLAGSDGDKNPDRPVFASGTLYDVEKYCLISGHKKLIFNSPEKKRPLAGFTSRVAFELYDIDKDPLEKQPLAIDGVKEFLMLKTELERFIRLYAGGKGQKTSIAGDKELQDKLKSLGYL